MIPLLRILNVGLTAFLTRFYYLEENSIDLISTTDLLDVLEAYSDNRLPICCGKNSYVILSSYLDLNERFVVCNVPPNILILGDTLYIYSDKGWLVKKENL